MSSPLANGPELRNTVPSPKSACVQYISSEDMDGNNIVEFANLLVFSSSEPRHRRTSPVLCINLTSEIRGMRGLECLVVRLVAVPRPASRNFRVSKSEITDNGIVHIERNKSNPTAF
jgi:hypothetical protein